MCGTPRATFESGRVENNCTVRFPSRPSLVPIEPKFIHERLQASVRYVGRKYGRGTGGRTCWCGALHGRAHPCLSGGRRSASGRGGGGTGSAVPAADWTDEC